MYGVVYNYSISTVNWSQMPSTLYFPRIVITVCIFYSVLVSWPCNADIQHWCMCCCPKTGSYKNTILHYGPNSGSIRRLVEFTWTHHPTSNQTLCLHRNSNIRNLLWHWCDLLRSGCLNTQETSHGFSTPFSKAPSCWWALNENITLL